MNTYFHSGDMGDCIAALPTIRQLGGGKLILGRRDGKWGRIPMTDERFDVIAPLLRAQEYITEVIHQDDSQDITHDFHSFRTKPPPQSPTGCGTLGYNLATWQANWFGIAPNELDLSSWLTVPRRGDMEFGAVFSRSMRYRNHGFDWSKMINDWEKPVFIGLQEEYFDFSKIPGGSFVEYVPTKDLFEAAEIISRSEIFIGNQSAPCWIALGLGKNLIQEMDTWEINRNSVIERENAQYVA